MRIAIEKGHNTLKEQLAQRGYEVFTMGEGSRRADVIIYYNRLPETYSIPDTFSNARLDFAAGSALLINGNGQSLESVENIIHKRVYSPLL